MRVNLFKLPCEVNKEKNARIKKIGFTQKQLVYVKLPSHTAKKSIIPHNNLHH